MHCSNHFPIFLIIILSIIYLSLFKSKDPTISIAAFQLPTYTLSSHGSSVGFTFSLAAIKNTNRVIFSHFNSFLQPLYGFNQVGFMFIPDGRNSVNSSNILTTVFSGICEGGGDIMVMMWNILVTNEMVRVKLTMELETRLEMVGRVRVLWFFSHHVKTILDYQIVVAISNGSVLGFHC